MNKLHATHQFQASSMSAKSCVTFTWWIPTRGFDVWPITTTSQSYVEAFFTCMMTVSKNLRQTKICLLCC